MIMSRYPDVAVVMVALHAGCEQSNSSLPVLVARMLAHIACLQAISILLDALMSAYCCLATYTAVVVQDRLSVRTEPCQD